MRDSWWRRALCALMALWFGVFVAEPEWLHACAVHGAAGAGGHVVAAAPRATSGHQPAHDGAPYADSADRAAPPHAPAGHHVPARTHACTCPGACSAVSPPALPAVAEHPVLEVLVAAVDRGRPEHEYVAAWVDFVLPFAHAPPPAALA